MVVDKLQDYHVFAVYGNDKHGYCVLDLDTTLPFPVSFKEYAQKAICCEDGIFQRLAFLNSLCLIVISTRKNMVNNQTSHCLDTFA